MLKKILLCLLLLPSLAQSEQVALRFDRLPIVEAARLLYGQIDRESYMVMPDFDSSENLVTLDLIADNPKSAKMLFEKYLVKSGFDVLRESGVVLLSKSQARPEKLFHRTYFPKHQSAESLRRLVFAGLGKKSDQPSLLNGDSESSPGSVRGQGQASSDVLVFSGSADEVALFDSLVDKLDVRLDQIHISAAVIEVSKSSANQSALQILANFFNGNVALDVAPSPLPFSFSLGSGGLSAAITALDTDSRFSLISSPSILVQSGQTAAVEIGAEVPVLSSTTTTDGGNQTQAIEYRTAGVLFEVEPIARREGIEIKVSQTLSDFVRTDTGIDNSPTLLKRSVNSNLYLVNDDVVAFAGLNEAQKSSGTATFSLFPFPVSESSSKSLREIVVLLQAKKVN